LIAAALADGRQMQVRCNEHLFYFMSVPDYFMFPYMCGDLTICLQCFDAVGWAAGRASGLYKTERWGAGMVTCLE